MAIPNKIVAEKPAAEEVPASPSKEEGEAPNIFELLSNEEIGDEEGSNEFPGDDDELPPDDSEDEGSSEEPSKKPAQPAAEEAAPTEQTKEEPPKAPKPEEASQPTAQEPPAPPAPPAQPEPPAQKTLTPEEYQRQMDEAYATAVDQLAAHYGKSIPKERREEIDGVLGEGFADLYARDLARVYTDAVQGAIRYASQILPQQVMQMQQLQTAVQSEEEKFFAGWPQLDATNAQHKQTVYAIGHAIRAAEPNISPEDFARKVGAAAMMSLGIVPQQPPVPEPAPPAPAFTPAASGGRASTPVPGNQSQSNIFTQFANEELAWDDSE